MSGTDRSHLHLIEATGPLTKSESEPPSSKEDQLLAWAIAAHGGFDRPNKFNKVTATAICLWPMKGLELGSIPR